MAFHSCRHVSNLLVLAVAVTILLSSPILSSAKGTLHRDVARIRVCKDKHHCITAEPAVTPTTRERGLMFRKSLPEDRGMLFVFPWSYYWNFWMKDTRIPLDMVWLNKDGRVVHIVNKAQPCVSEPCRIYGSREKSLYVLELASGIAEKWHLKTGDKLLFKVPLLPW